MKREVWSREEIPAPQTGWRGKGSVLCYDRVGWTDSRRIVYGRLSTAK